MIRQATAQDVAGIAELLRVAWQESGLKTPYHEGRALRGLGFMLNNPDTYASVVEHDGQIVAALIGARSMSWWFRGDIAQDQCFYALPAHRGKALPLLRDFIRWAHEWGSVRQISMHINNPGNIRTARLYQSLGFVPAGGSFVKEI